MAFFHLKTVPGHQWPPLPDAVFSQVWNAYLELDRTQWLDRPELEQRQLSQVRTLLAHCVAHVPYYRQILAKAGISPASIETMEDFRRIPLLPRRTYQEAHTSVISAKLPAGTVAGLTSQTSGSSGAPTMVYGTNMTQLWWHAFYLRDLEWCNIDPTGTLAAIRHSSTTGPELQRRVQGVSAPCWSPALDPLIQTGPSHGMDIRQDPRLQLLWLRDLAPDYLLSLPANLEALALLARHSGPVAGLRGIQAIASTLTPEAKTLIESVFGVPVHNTYSCYEAGYLASPCPSGAGLHVHAENVVLEVLDEADRPCQPGQTGRVFITHLHNLRGPFVRYDLGDEAALAAEPCPCGRGLPLLTRVYGKRFPMFRLPTGVFRHCATLSNQMRQVGGHWQHQVVQKAEDHVVIRLAADPAWTDHHAEEMKRIVQEFFESAIRVDLEFHDCLALPRSGKFQSMISEVE